MAATLEELAALEAAINSGVLTARDRAGRVITYRSREEMIATRDEMRRELNLETSNGRSRRRVWTYNRGT